MTKISTKTHLIPNWYDKDDVEILIRRKISEEEWKKLRKRFYCKFNFSLISEYIREFTEEFLRKRGINKN